MKSIEKYRRRVGTVRPSHLMFTNGIGALIDLPNFAVLVQGLDDWNYGQVQESPTIAEPRLLAAVKKMRGKQVTELRSAPWLAAMDHNLGGEEARVGVPVIPFPTWMRCTACNELAPIESGVVFGFQNDKARRPHEARFFHQCGNRSRKTLAVPARFVLACTNGHLDDFPYQLFVHRGGPCPIAEKPSLKMDDYGGNVAANVKISCQSCEEWRNIREALGRRGEENLPSCRGRHPHLSTYQKGCTAQPKLLILGASNQWFAETMSALAVPESGASALATKVAQHWDTMATISTLEFLVFARGTPIPSMKEFVQWTDQEFWDAIEAHRSKLAGSAEPDPASNLRAAEWAAFSSVQIPEPTDDFTLRRDPNGVPDGLKGIYADVVQAERLREVRALIGFTRLDAPDPEDPELVTVAPLAREPAKWVPASDVRGEGIFLRVSEELIVDWQTRITDSDSMLAHREAYGRFRENRYSDRINATFDRMRGWPGERYYALHTLSHLLIRTIALECGYSSASLAERIYAGSDEDPWGGILIYTAVPDAEGTLGGLVTLAEPDSLQRLTRRALTDACRCSSDPLCAERRPAPPSDFLHGAACHVCLFVSETTCERGNRFLDRRFVVPVDDPALALFPELP